MLARIVLTGLFVSLGLFGCSASPHSFTTIKTMEPVSECSQCRFMLLPGTIEPTPHSRYTIHSDLPEILTSDGVVYSTLETLPPFNTFDGKPVSHEFRTQVNRGFETIDGDFEVFLFHISQPGDGSKPRRMVVYVENAGTEPVSILPRQVIMTDGIIGTVHEMESTLGRRVMSEDWDTPFAEVKIAPGSGELVAFSKKFAANANNNDSSRNVNCFGIVRGAISSDAKPNLKVYVVGIPASDDFAKSTAETRNLLTVGANSGEKQIDLTSEPVGCQLRRTTGVFKSFLFRSGLVSIDASELGTTPKVFQMALPAVQAPDCPDAVQTAPMLLHSKASRPDTVGNYMTDYYVSFNLINPSKSEPQKFDIRFGKNDMDIGLGYQVITAIDRPTQAQLEKTTVHTTWAGPKQTEDFSDNTRSFLEFDGGPIELAPGENRHVAIRFQVLGNSSLPFQLHVVKP